MPERVARAIFDELYAAVSALLVDGRYRPGDRIGLKELATQLHVSVTPLREIMSRLVGRGIVTERRAEGYYLVRLDARDIADLYRLHFVLVAEALQADPPAPAVEAVSDIWAIFRAIVRATDDAILADTHAYLSDRLALVRRSDAALVDDAGTTATAIARAWQVRDIVLVEQRSRVFHDRRIAAAPTLAQHFGRGGASSRI